MGGSQESSCWRSLQNSTCKEAKETEGWTRPHWKPGSGRPHDAGPASLYTSQPVTGRVAGRAVRSQHSWPPGEQHQGPGGAVGWHTSHQAHQGPSHQALTWPSSSPLAALRAPLSFSLRSAHHAAARGCSGNHVTPHQIWAPRDPAVSPHPVQGEILSSGCPGPCTPDTLRLLGFCAEESGRPVLVRPGHLGVTAESLRPGNPLGFRPTGTVGPQTSG